MDIKKIQKLIKKRDFYNAYIQLSRNQYVFNFDNLVRDFPKVDSQRMYVFLMYAISKDEDVEKHIAICNYLYFMAPYIFDADSLIKWHLLRALEIAHDNRQTIYDWICSIYDGNPDCPFSEEELEKYRK